MEGGLGLGQPLAPARGPAGGADERGAIGPIRGTIDRPRCNSARELSPGAVVPTPPSRLAGLSPLPPLRGRDSAPRRAPARLAAAAAGDPPAAPSRCRDSGKSPYPPG